MLFTYQAAAHAQSTVTFPRLEPDPKAVQFFRPGRQNNSYTWLELAEISLWASGDTSASNLEKIRQTVIALNNSRDLPASKKEKAEYILTYLHRNILRTYSLNQARVDTIFTNGRYNCVSSAVLYMILCKAAGIEVSGVLTRVHAFVTVHIDGEDIDVETTNRYGFNPGNKKEFHDQFGRTTGFSYVPVQNYRDRRTISQIELISEILITRISEHEKQNLYSDAVPLAIDKAFLLLGDSLTSDSDYFEEFFKDPRKDLMESLFNYGTWLLRTNREEDCLRWTEVSALRYPDNRWQEFNKSAVNNRVARFVRENKIPEAREFLENKRNILSIENYIQIDSVVMDAELLKRANQITTTAEGDAVISEIEQMRKNGKMNERRAVEIRTLAIQKTAIVISSQGSNWRVAIHYIENALSEYGTNQTLEQSLRLYQNNLAGDYHNRFAAEWNSKNYDEAERILSEGLAEFPNNRQLLADKDLVNKSRSR